MGSWTVAPGPQPHMDNTKERTVTVTVLNYLFMHYSRRGKSVGQDVDLVSSKCT